MIQCMCTIRRAQVCKEHVNAVIVRRLVQQPWVRMLTRTTGRPYVSHQTQAII
jgi:hypothetical protein